MAAIEPHQFRKTQPGTVHDFKHGAIAHRQRIVKIDIQQLIHFINVDVFRQMTAAAWRSDPFGRVGNQHTLADLPVEKTAQRRQAQREAGRL
ncbi:hypothetical protein D3C81_1648690 [compost metagenome]